MKSTLMKAFILIFFNMTLRQAALAGPFVSGGMPGALVCEDAHHTINIKMVYLGDLVEFSGRRAGAEGSVPLDYTCEVRNEPVPRAYATQLAFECHSQASEDLIQVFRNLETHRTWGLLMGRTSQGVPAPTTLNCEKANL